MSKDRGFLELEYRMYGLVPYNISPIQQAIQYGHALQEYNNAMFEQLYKDKWQKSKKDDDFIKFQKWANKDKTFIILNGGTTNKQPSITTGEPFGTLDKYALQLNEQKIKIATFNEPDLNDALTAVVFLVDERVFDKKKYPDFEEKPTSGDIDGWHEDYLNWVDDIGGDTNVWLREFLSQFRLA